VNCINAFYDHRPFDANSGKGVAIAMLKRALIGLIATAAIAVGLYFLDMAVYNVWNPCGLSLSTQMGLSIAACCLFAVAGIILTGAWMHFAKNHQRA
jgi:hypothetical protein